MNEQLKAAACDALTAELRGFAEAAILRGMQAGLTELEALELALDVSSEWSARAAKLEAAEEDEHDAE